MLSSWHCGGGSCATNLKLSPLSGSKKLPFSFMVRKKDATVSNGVSPSHMSALMFLPVEASHNGVSIPWAGPADERVRHARRDGPRHVHHPTTGMADDDSGSHHHLMGVCFYKHCAETPSPSVNQFTNRAILA